MQEVAILDFGSQYTHLIARAIRELGVVSRIHPNDVKADSLNNAAGLILSGGPKSILSDDALGYDPKIFDLKIPVLGLCYGHQLIAAHFGGKVTRGGKREYGLASLKTADYRLKTIFEHIPNKSTVWMSHGDHVEELPDGFVSIGQTDSDPNTAVANIEKKIYGFQFHPEVTHSEHGSNMLKNFVFNICKAQKNWTIDDMLQNIEEEIKKAAGDKKVFLLISGGVDSTVCFALLEKILGKNRVYGFHVDHGFMRQNESAWVRDSLAHIGLDNLHVYNAEEEFLSALKGVVDPEEKRKIIGNLFLDITERVMCELNFNEKEWLLGQGTIYPDTIESGGMKNSDKIKTHHNRVDRVTEMIEKGLVIEPIKDLYKDEVRRIGLSLGLPEPLINRHPFPGPGLAIRCLCSSGSEDTPTTLQLYNSTTITKLPIKSVGVQGDERTYKHPAVLLNQSLDYTTLRDISPKITNSQSDVNRVLVTMCGQEDRIPESRVCESNLTKERIKLLQQLDKAITDILLKSDCNNVWQMPVVLVPFGYKHGESLVIRPAESREVMTIKFAELPKDMVTEMTRAVERIGGVDFVFYDVTNKPPGTMEWE